MISIEGKFNEPSPPSLQLRYFQNKIHKTQIAPMPSLVYLSAIFKKIKTAEKQKCVQFCHVLPPVPLKREGGCNIQCVDQPHLVVGVRGLGSLAADAFEFGRYPRYQAASPHQRVGLTVRVISSHFICSCTVTITNHAMTFSIIYPNKTRCDKNMQVTRIHWKHYYLASIYMGSISSIYTVY